MGVVSRLKLKYVKVKVVDEAKPNFNFGVSEKAPLQLKDLRRQIESVAGKGYLDGKALYVNEKEVRY